VIAEGLDDFIRLVIPVLQRRGYFEPHLEGRTLREHLGLPFKDSIYSHAESGSSKAIA
jgi:hypothetical protein